MRLLSIISVFCLLLIDSSRACTSFLMDTPEGPIFGENLDLFVPGDGLVFINQRGIAKENFQENTKGEKATWISKYGSVTFNLAGREIAWGGMNEAGLVVGTMELVAGEFPEPDERKPLTVGGWVQYVLDTCDSIDQVIQLDKEIRIEDSAPPNHYFVSDAEGNCVAIEWFKGKFHYRVGETLAVKAMANMPYDRSAASYERGGHPRWWWSNPGRSAQRACSAEYRSRTYDANSNTNAVAYALQTLTDVVTVGHTKWNVVYDISKREIWYRTSVSPEVKKISFEDCDFSCNAQLMMIDVNTPLKDNITKKFVPFDYEVNKQVFWTLCERYKIKLSDEDVENVQQTFARSKCASKECERKE